MKKVFMPSIDGLKKMQSLDADVYSYIQIKTIEKFIIEGVNYSKKGILNPELTRKYILEDPDIIIPICRLYPELISRFEFASCDASLCLELLNQDTNNNYQSNLDNLSYFDKSTICGNQLIIKEVTKMLMEELNNNPKYRFTYQDSTLLNQIFSTTVISDNNLFYTNDDKWKLLSDLSMIEPYYVIKKYQDEELLKEYYQSELIACQKELLNISIESYKKRYNINKDNEYLKKDIFTKENNKVKRLIKQINNDKLLLYKNI